MTSPRVEFEWGGVRLALLADRAVHRPDRSTLYVADLHLGKPEHFRAAGVPAPEELTDADLSRLDVLISTTGAERLVVLGDLFHDRVRPGGETAGRLIAWRRTRGSLCFQLVPGNHDRWAGDVWADFGIERLDPVATDEPLTLVHDPDHTPEGACALSGHLHPAVRLGARGRPSLRSACFWFTERVGVLPAFGRFTGTRLVHPAPGDRVAMIDRGAIVDVSRALGPHSALRA